MVIDNKGMKCEARRGDFTLVDKSGTCFTISFDCAFGMTISETEGEDGINLHSPDDNWSFEYTGALAATLLSVLDPAHAEYIMSVADKLRSGDIKSISASDIDIALQQILPRGA